MSKVFEMDIPTGQKFVLLALADRAGDDGKSCFPSQKEIAKKTSITVRSVQKHLVWLEGEGLLKRVERRRKDGYRTTDEYILTLDNEISGEEFSGENISGEKKCKSQAKNFRGNELPTVINNTSVDTSCLIDDDLFDQFWILFPRQRRGGKENARKAFNRALKRAAPQEIMGGLQAYCASDEVAKGYAKGAAAWLNDDRWTTDYRKGSTNEPTKPIDTVGDEIIAELRQERANRQAGGAVLCDTGHLRQDTLAIENFNQGHDC
jgi:biotin operon repressor